MQLRRHAVRERGPRTLAALACLLLVVLSPVPVGLGRVPAPDRIVRHWVTTHQQRRAFAVLDALTRVAHWQWVCLALIAVACVVAVAQRSSRPVRQAVLAVLVELVVVWILKAVFARPGPTGVAPPPHDGAWPSGHAVALVVATVVLLRMRPSVRPVATVAAFLPAAVLSAALVYCGDHWFTDVAVAFPLGLLLGWAGLRVEAWASTRIGRARAPAR